MALIPALAAACAVPLFAWADRKVGGDDKNPKRTGYGAVLAYGAALVAASFYFPGFRDLAVIGALTAIWCAYRSLPWKMGGSTTPRTTGEVVKAFIRHMLPGLLLGGLWLAGGSVPHVPTFSIFALAPFPLYAAYATAGQVRFAQLVDRTNDDAVVRKANAQTETSRGLAFGVAFLIAGLAL